MEEKEMPSQLKKVVKLLWDGTSRILLFLGLCVFIVLWCVVIFFMWIYDAIFGGWK